MAAVVKEYGGAVLAAVGGVVFLGTLGQFLLSRQGLIMQMIAMVSEMSVFVEKGIPGSRALCETDTGAFEGYWRSR